MPLTSPNAESLSVNGFVLKYDCDSEARNGILLSRERIECVEGFVDLLSSNVRALLRSCAQHCQQERKGSESGVL